MSDLGQRIVAGQRKRKHRGLHYAFIGGLFRYLDEQTFRYNNRKDMDDSDRFTLALSRITGKRLTYDHLTGKDAGLPPAMAY